MVTFAVVEAVRSTPSFCHFWKVFPPVVAGALNETVAFWLKTRVNVVVPPALLLLSSWYPVMLTPLLGLDDATVSVRVGGGAAANTAVTVEFPDKVTVGERMRTRLKSSRVALSY